MTTDRKTVEQCSMDIIAALAKKGEGTVQDIALASGINWETTYRYLLLLQKIGVVKASVKYSLRFDRLKLLQGCSRERTFEEFEQYNQKDDMAFFEIIAKEAAARREVK